MDSLAIGEDKAGEEIEAEKLTCGIVLVGSRLSKRSCDENENSSVGSGGKLKVSSVSSISSPVASVNSGAVVEGWS